MILEALKLDVTTHFYYFSNRGHETNIILFKDELK